MSQISLHALMYQQKLATSHPIQQQSQLLLSINNDAAIDQHCGQIAQNNTLNNNASIQCQSIISISDSLSVNSILFDKSPDFVTIPFLLSYRQSSLNKIRSKQLTIFNFVIKTFFPPLTLKLHSFLI
ncbi:MAG: hypothetical protein QM479_15370 [Pseudomonadota bacterium]